MPVWRFINPDETSVEVEGETWEQARAEAQRRYTEGRRGSPVEQNTTFLGDLGDHAGGGLYDALRGIVAIPGTLPRGLSQMLPNAQAERLAAQATGNDEQLAALNENRFGGWEQFYGNLTGGIAERLSQAAVEERMSLSDASRERARAYDEWSNNPQVPFINPNGVPFDANQIPGALAEQAAASAAPLGIAAINTLLFRGSGAGNLAEGAISGGMSANSIAEEIASIAYNNPEEFLNGAVGRAAMEQADGDFNRAVQIAQRRANEIAPVIAAQTAALGAVGGDWVEGLQLVRRNILEGFLREASEEGLQSAGETLLQNYAVRGVDPDRDLLEGVGSSALQGTILGGLTGGAFGALSRRYGRDPAASDSAAGTDSPVTPADPGPVSPAAPAAEEIYIGPERQPDEPEEPTRPTEPVTPTQPWDLTQSVIGDEPIAPLPDSARGMVMDQYAMEDGMLSSSRTGRELFDLGIVNENDVPVGVDDWYKTDEGETIPGNRAAELVPLYATPPDYDPLKTPEGENLRAALRNGILAGEDINESQIGQTLQRSRGARYYPPGQEPEGAKPVGFAYMLHDEYGDFLSQHIVPLSFKWDKENIPTTFETDPRLPQPESKAAPVQEQTQPETPVEPEPVAQQATPPAPVQEQEPTVLQQRIETPPPAPEKRVPPNVIRDLSERIDDPEASADIQLVRKQILDRGDKATAQEKDFLILSDNTDEVPVFNPPEGVELKTARTKEDGREFDVTVADRTQIVDTGYDKLKARAGKDFILSMDGKPYSVVTPEVFDVTYDRLPNGKVKAKVGRKAKFYIAPEDAIIKTKENKGVAVKNGEPVLQGPAGEWYPPGGMANFQRKYEIVETPKERKTGTLSLAKPVKVDVPGAAKAEQPVRTLKQSKAMVARNESEEAEGLSDELINEATRMGNDAARNGLTEDQLAKKLRNKLRFMDDLSEAQKNEYHDAATDAYALYKEEEMADDETEEEIDDDGTPLFGEEDRVRAEKQGREAAAKGQTREQVLERLKGETVQEYADTVLASYDAVVAQYPETGTEVIQRIVDKLKNDKPLTKEEVKAGRAWKAERLNAADLNTTEKQFRNLMEEFNDAAAALRPAKKPKEQSVVDEEVDEGGFTKLKDEGRTSEILEPGSREALQQEAIDRELELVRLRKEAEVKRSQAAIEKAWRDATLKMFGPQPPRSLIASYADVNHALSEFNKHVAEMNDLVRQPGVVPKTIAETEFLNNNLENLESAIRKAWKGRGKASMGAGFTGGRQLPVSDPQWTREMKDAILAAAKCSAAGTVGVAGAAGLTAALADPLAATSYVLAGVVATPTIMAGVKGFNDMRARQADAERRARDMYNVMPFSQAVDESPPEPWTPPLDETEEMPYNDNTTVDAAGIEWSFGEASAGWIPVYRDGVRVKSVTEPYTAGRESQRNEADDEEYTRRLMALVDEFRNEQAALEGD